MVKQAKDQEKFEKLKNTDFINHRYKYLNSDFSINIPSKVFQKTIKKNPYYNNAEFMSYNDSLLLVLMAEFKDHDKAIFAQDQINYSWQTLGYQLWQTPDSA